MATRIEVLGETLVIKASPSFLKQAACPRSLHEGYVRKSEDRTVRLEAVRGRVVHEILAELTRLCLERKIQPQRLRPEEARQVIIAALPHEMYDEVGLILAWVALWRERYELSRHIAGHEDRLAIYFDGREAPWDDADARGIFDEITIEQKLCRVTDYKSQAQILSQQALREHEQMLFYCWMLWRFYPHLDTYSARIWYLRYGFAQEVHYSVDELKRFEERLFVKLELIRKIGSWAPIAGTHCNVCDFVHTCPIGNDASLLPEEILTVSQAKRVAQALRVREGYVSKARSLLKNYVEENGPVELGGATGDRFVYGFKPSLCKSYEDETVLRVLDDHGLPVTDAYKLDRRRLDRTLKKLREEDDGAAAEIEASATESGTTQFKGYVPGGDGEDETE